MLGETKHYYTRLRVDPLPAENAGELLAALLGDHAALQPLKRILLDRTEGNPFFLEESIRALVETKVLTGERGSYRLEKPLGTTQVPATVQAVWLLGSIDSRPKRSGSSSPPPLLERISLALLQAIAEQSAEELRRDSLGYRRRSFSTRRICFLISNTLSNMRSLTKWLTEVFCRSGAATFTRRSSNLSRSSILIA